ncbi:CRPV-271 [Crowpox virus]|nr:CRPV-271 [Crowpox virus]
MQLFFYHNKIKFIILYIAKTFVYLTSKYIREIHCVMWLLRQLRHYFHKKPLYNKSYKVIFIISYINYILHV